MGAVSKVWDFKRFGFNAFMVLKQLLVVSFILVEGLAEGLVRLPGFRAGRKITRKTKS